MSPIRFILLASVACAIFPQANPCRADGRQIATMEMAIDVVEEIASVPDQSIPLSVMQRANGIAIIPNVIKGGFVIGGRFGRGVIMARDRNGDWSNPVFITLTGGSVGWQIGAEATDVILIFKRRETIEGILRREKLTIGAGAAVAAGPVGRQTEAGTDVQLRAEIFSYSRSRGLFAGVSLEGSILKVDYRANEYFYHDRDATPFDILDGRVEAPRIVGDLKQILDRQAGRSAAREREDRRRN